MPKTAKTKTTRPRRVRLGLDKRLAIFVGWQNDGGVYQLPLGTVDRIHEAYPQAIGLRTMLLGYDKTEDYNRFHRPYWPQVAQMLTGLAAEQIAQLGGIVIYDPEAEKIIWEWLVPPARGVG